MGEDNGPMNTGNLYDEQQRIIRELRAELARWHACNDAEIAANAKACELLAQVKPEVERLRAERDAARAECAAWRALMKLQEDEPDASLDEIDALCIVIADTRQAHDTLCPNWHPPTTGGQGEGGKHE